jgi:hypothetical protein
VQDEVPTADYAIQKVLRKNIQDVSEPMHPSELSAIRKAIQSPYQSDADLALPLTEAEIDEAIRRGVKLNWRVKRKLAHVLVAWRLRVKDPGSAPVLGERVKYIVALNGLKQITAKAEPLALVEAGAVEVDRRFYLDALRKAVDGLFAPIFEQRGLVVKVEADRMLWPDALEGQLQHDAKRRRDMVTNSPIVKAFFAPKPAAITNGEKSEGPAGVLTPNHAEHAKMKEQKLRQISTEKDRKRASMEASPLLKAFAAMANKRAKPS